MPGLQAESLEKPVETKLRNIQVCPVNVIMSYNNYYPMSLVKCSGLHFLIIKHHCYANGYQLYRDSYHAHKMMYSLQEFLVHKSAVVEHAMKLVGLHMASSLSPTPSLSSSSVTREGSLGRVSPVISTPSTK